jgi:hypothetical protein
VTERPYPCGHVPNEAGFAPLVLHWLTDSDSREWFAPPFTESQVAAIDRHLLASAN